MLNIKKSQKKISEKKIEVNLSESEENIEEEKESLQS